MKSKYETHVLPNLDLIKGWREEGKTKAQIAEKLFIGESTFRTYSSKYEALKAALSASKQRLVENLKKSLWEEALGYEYEETKTIIEESYLGTKKKVEKTKKKARSQANLLIFALCNLYPEMFKRVDKEAVEELKEAMKDELTDKRLKLVYKLMNPNLTDEQLEKDTKKVKVVGEDE